MVFWKLARSGLVFLSLGIFYGILAFGDPDADSNTYFSYSVVTVLMVLVAAYHAYAAFQQRRTMRSQHVAVTKEGVRLDLADGLTVTVLFEDIREVKVQTDKSCFREATFQSVRIVRVGDPSFFSFNFSLLELHGVLQSQEFATLVEAESRRALSL